MIIFFYSNKRKAIKKAGNSLFTNISYLNWVIKIAHPINHPTFLLIKAFLKLKIRLILLLNHFYGDVMTTLLSKFTTEPLKFIKYCSFSI